MLRIDFRLLCNPENQVVLSMNAISGIVSLRLSCGGWLISSDYWYESL